MKLKRQRQTEGDGGGWGGGVGWGGGAGLSVWDSEQQGVVSAIAGRVASEGWDWMGSERGQ